MWLWGADTKVRSANRSRGSAGVSAAVAGTLSLPHGKAASRGQDARALEFGHLTGPKGRANTALGIAQGGPLQSQIGPKGVR